MDIKMQRLLNEFCGIAGSEIVDIDSVDGAIFGFGTELGVLRLYRKYVEAGVEECRVGYSENLETHYFMMDN